MNVCKYIKKISKKEENIVVKNDEVRNFIKKRIIYI